MSDSLRALGYNLIFVSNKISIVVKSIINYNEYVLIKKSNLAENIPDLSKCFDVRTGLTSLSDAEVLYSSVYNTFIELQNKYRIEFVFIWNGLSIQTFGVSDFALKTSVKTRFFELSNIPGKLFVNPSGVNAKSSLYHNLSILDGYTSNKYEFEKWKKQYIEFKQKQFPPPQVNVKKIQNYLFFIDLIGFYLLKLPANGQTNIWNKMKSLLKSRVIIRYDDYSFSNNKFIFLPLQVNTDSQLTFYSNCSNIYAILFGFNLAKERNTDLVVKIHPAENDEKFINTILKMKKEVEFFLVNYSTTDLITYSQLVLTINSTVGLEAKIMNKEVLFLGKSIYCNMKYQHISNYIIRYLINVEYFSKDKIDIFSIKKIFEII